jgi:hypothetical protein
MLLAAGFYTMRTLVVWVLVALEREDVRLEQWRAQDRINAEWEKGRPERELRERERAVRWANRQEEDRGQCEREADRIEVEQRRADELRRST